MASSDQTQSDVIIAAIQARFYAMQEGKYAFSQKAISEEVFTEFVPELCRLMLNYLGSTESTASSSTAEEIDLAIPAIITEPREGYDAAYFLWTIILRVVYEIPHDHEYQTKLAALIQAFTELPEDDVDRHLADQTNEWQSLKDLPDLSFRVGEIWYGVWPGIKPHDEGELSSTQMDRWTAWLRLNAFSARCCALGIKHDQFSRWLTISATLTLGSTVLEMDFKQPEQIRRDMTVCSVWILYCGEKLHAAQREGEVEDWEYKGGDLYTGRPGLCQERWDFWHKRFLEIANLDLEIDADTRQLARDMAAHMENTEASKTGNKDEKGH